ncbi:MAG: hypothetical protein K6T55_12380 [Syntrophobacterales bacterium]|nr:hypothetical protein [Syntrophobacterales bacterium]
MTTPPTPQAIDAALAEARELMAAGQPQAALAAALRALNMSLATLHSSLVTMRDKLTRLNGEMARLKDLYQGPALPADSPRKYRH